MCVSQRHMYPSEKSCSISLNEKSLIIKSLLFRTTRNKLRNQFESYHVKHLQSQGSVLVEPRDFTLVFCNDREVTTEIVKIEGRDRTLTPGTFILQTQSHAIKV